MGEEAILPTSSSGGELMLPFATWAQVHALARHGRSIRGIAHDLALIARLSDEHSANPSRSPTAGRRARRRWPRMRRTSACGPRRSTTMPGDCCASRLMRTRSVGVSPTEGQARPLVAWAAEGRETDDLKPADKAIFGMVSEPPGRSESAREVASSKMRSGGRATSNLAKAVWERHIWQMSRSRSGGVISGGMVARARRATGEILPAPM
jgi:hypothetical protein